MNLAQLHALATAGAITWETYQASAATATPAGQVTDRPQLQLHVAGQLDAVSDETDETGARIVAGVASVYEYLIPSHQMILHTGSLVPRQPLDRNKLLRDHNHADPVGYLTALDADSLACEWHVPSGDNGDRALQEAADKLRDGLSVGFTAHADGYDFDDDWVLHVWSADWYETSLCAVPAISDAGVTNLAAALTTNRKVTAMTREQLDAALAAGTITQAAYDARLAQLQLAAPAAPAAPAAAPAWPAELAADVAAGPVQLGDPSSTPAARTVSRGLSVHELAGRIGKARETGNPQAVLAAIQLAVAEHNATDDPATAYYGRPDGVGETGRAGVEGRPWIDSLGGPKDLTAGKIEGFQWETKIAPKKYTRDPATEAGKAVPTGKAKTKKVSMDPDRWAFSTGLDRILVDLGSEQLVRDLFVMLADGHKVESDADVATKMLAAADDQTALPDANVLAGIKAMARDFRAIGAKLDVIRMAPDVFDRWADLKIADLPAWLANQMGFVNLADGTSQLGELTLSDDNGLTDGELAGYDKRAATAYESKTIQLESIAVASGEIHLGWYSYGGLLVNDARAIQRREITLA